MRSTAQKKENIYLHIFILDRDSKQLLVKIYMPFHYVGLGNG